MSICYDCINYDETNIRQCRAYNNDCKPNEDTTHCCEFIPRGDDMDCLKCKYSKQVGEKVFYCRKHKRNCILTNCKTTKDKIKDIIKKLFNH